MRIPLWAYSAIKAELSLLKRATKVSVKPNTALYNTAASASAVPQPSRSSFFAPAISFLP